MVVDGVYHAKELPATNAKSSFLSFLNLSGTKLDQEALDPLLRKMKEHLISRNVAAETAADVAVSVTRALTGKHVGALNSVSTVVKEAFRSVIEKILLPNASTDLLRLITDARQQNRPYSIAFIGVNGVGKSTNLSKVCFWLLQNKLRVLIAACDTFRAGAVEQLKTHVRNLKALEEGADVELFDRGYGKDPAGIAQEALQFAKKQGYDVVLIDTAGRMQGNIPLMRALAKVINLT